MVVRLLNATPGGRLSPTALVDPDADYLKPDGASDLPAILRVGETPQHDSGDISETNLEFLPSATIVAER